MNTDTGRIYGADVMAEAQGRPMVNFDGFTSYSDPSAALTREQEVAELQHALARGEAVPVSARVAQQQTLGQRELRRRKRRATKDARRRNR
jgi:hypothetical protein